MGKGNAALFTLNPYAHAVFEGMLAGDCREYEFEGVGKKKVVVLQCFRVEGDKDRKNSPLVRVVAWDDMGEVLRENLGKAVQVKCDITVYRHKAGYFAHEYTVREIKQSRIAAERQLRLLPGLTKKDRKERVKELRDAKKGRPAPALAENEVPAEDSFDW